MSKATHKRFWIMTVLIVCGTVAFACADAQTAAAKQKAPTARPAQPASRAQLDQAENLIAKSDFAGAEPLLLRVTEADPKDFRALYDLGYVYRALNRPADAIAALRKSVALKPDVFESNLNLGLLLEEQGSADAATYLSKATTLKPESNANHNLARAWLGVGRVLSAGKPSDAVNAFAQAARLDPKTAEPHLQSAILLEKQKDYASAEREFKQAAALDPHSSEALAGLVNVYTETRRLPEAETALRQFIQLDPQNNNARVQLGRVLVAEGKTADALPLLEGALKQQRDPAALRELAGLHAVNKQYDEAASEYRELLQTSPNDADLHYALGTVLMNNKDLPGAQQEFIAAVNAKRDFIEAYGNLAVVAAENKNYPLALKALDTRAQYAPESAATYFLRATSYDNLRDAKNAIENYHRFLEVANGKFPDQEWQARHRLIAIDPKARK
jgi:Flp pilus assembly protein TadD